MSVCSPPFQLCVMVILFNPLVPAKAGIQLRRWYYLDPHLHGDERG